MSTWPASVEAIQELTPVEVVAALLLRRLLVWLHPAVPVAVPQLEAVTVQLAVEAASLLAVEVALLLAVGVASLLVVEVASLLAVEVALLLAVAVVSLLAVVVVSLLAVEAMAPLQAVAEAKQLVKVGAWRLAAAVGPC